MCDVLVLASLSHFTGIRLYFLPWVFILFTILWLHQLFVGERERTIGVIKRENHRCDVLVWASHSHSHGIRLYCFPWIFLLFSILGLQQLLMREREREPSVENHWCDVLVWSSLLHGHGIIIY